MTFTGDIRQLKVLIVDDSKSVLSYMTAILMSQGFTNISTADSLDSALTMTRGIDGCPFDLVLLDRYLGEASGVEVLRKIRSFDNKVPIIMITQEDSGPKVIEAIEAGATDYIVKPFCIETISSKLSKIFKHSN